MVKPTSYLQTLAKDEAIAFVASLQSIKAHLSHELQRLSEQAQQKTIQLQGIETLLSEAIELDLMVADTHSTAETVVAAPTSSSVTSTVVTDENAVDVPTTANGNTSPAEATEPAQAGIAALPAKKTAKQPRSQPGKAAKPSRAAKPSATTKTSTPKAKQPQPSTPPANKATQRGKASNLQRFLKGQFRDQALTEAVSDILKRASAPLSTDEVMAALYDGLPKADYDRAKHSLANILSMGKGKGAWKSTGRGRYASNS